MVSKRKIDLEKVRASLFTVCLNCGHAIPPEKLKRIDSDCIQCPECGQKFVRQKANPSAK
jgi:RNA polymerase-binding transcription factor DksA